MITAQQAYSKAVTANAKQTLIDMKLKAINKSIDDAASNGQYEYLYDIPEGDIVRDVIINELRSNNYTVDTLEFSLYINWAQD